MRLRVRLAGKRTLRVEVPDDSDFDVLRATVVSLEPGVDPAWRFSLNKADPLDESGTIGAAGVSSGDLVFVLELPVPRNEGDAPHGPPPQSQPRTGAAESTRAPQEVTAASPTPRATSAIDVLRRQLARELKEASICIGGPSGAKPADYRAAAVLVAAHSVLASTGLVYVGERRWVSKWWHLVGNAGVALQYRHPQLEGASCEIKTCLLGNVMVLCAAATDDASLRVAELSTVVAQLRPAEYVRVLPTESVAGIEIYTTLSTLAIELQDSIVTPILNQMRLAAGLRERNCIVALAPEIKLLILSFCDANTLGKVAQVSRDFAELAGSDVLWLPRLDSGPEPPRGGARAAYVAQVLHRRKLAEQRRVYENYVRSPGRIGIDAEFSMPGSALPPRHGFPGVIGGDHDLFPFGGGLAGLPGAPHGRAPPGIGPDLRPGRGRGGSHMPRYPGMGPRMW